LLTILDNNLIFTSIILLVVLFYMSRPKPHFAIIYIGYTFPFTIGIPPQQ
jgi:hypothetical protein